LKSVDWRGVGAEMRRASRRHVDWNRTGAPT